MSKQQILERIEKRAATKRASQRRNAIITAARIMDEADFMASAHNNYSYATCPRLAEIVDRLIGEGVHPTQVARQAAKEY